MASGARGEGAAGDAAGAGHRSARPPERTAAEPDPSALMQGGESGLGFLFFAQFIRRGRRQKSRRLRLRPARRQFPLFREDPPPARILGKTGRIELSVIADRTRLIRLDSGSEEPQGAPASSQAEISPLRLRLRIRSRRSSARRNVRPHTSARPLRCLRKGSRSAQGRTGSPNACLPRLHCAQSGRSRPRRTPHRAALLRQPGRWGVPFRRPVKNPHLPIWLVKQANSETVAGPFRFLEIVKYQKKASSPKTIKFRGLHQELLKIPPAI